MSTKEFNIERFSLLSKKSFQDVLTSIEAQIGHPDIGKLFEDIARSKTDEELKAVVNDAVGPTDLMEFVRFDQGQVLRRELGDEAPQVLRLLIGNPLTMRKMVKFVHDAGSYAPVTILIDDRSDGVHVSYDRMASLIAPYGSAEALQAAKDLDSTVENILRNAAL
jgi:Domain of unknown function DUF302